MKERSEAVLIFDDGRVFRGTSYAAQGQAVGPLRLNSASTGYQELFTNPDTAGDILVMTWPHIGNTGVNDADNTSDTYWPAGVVVRDPSRRASHWQATGELEDALKAGGIIGISGVDTRAITRHLRECEVHNAGIFSGKNIAHISASDSPELEELVRQVRNGETQGKDGADA